MAPVVKTNQVRIRHLTGFHQRVFPGTTMPGWLAQFPEVIDRTRPNGGLFIVRNNDMIVFFGRLQVDASHHQQPPVRGIIVNTQVVR